MSDALPRRLPATAGPRAPALSMPPAPAWTALAHPAAWSLCRDNADGWHMLPSLIQIAHLAGVNGVVLGRDRDGRPVADPTPAVAEFTARGYVEVPPCAVYAHGREVPDYCVGHRAARGIVHTWAWVRPIIAQGRAVRQVDRDAEVAFRRWVMTDLLHIDSAPEDVLEAHRVRMRDRALRLCVEVRTRPAAARGLEILAQQLRSLGWDEGLPLPEEYRAVAPVAPARAVAAQVDDTAAELAALRAAQAELMAELAAFRAAQTSPSAPSPASEGGLVGSPDLGGGAVPSF